MPINFFQQTRRGLEHDPAAAFRTTSRTRSSAAISLISNFGHNTYHAATLRVEKRYSQGLTLNAFYTWSKTLNNVDDDGARQRHHLLQPEPGKGPRQLRHPPPLGNHGHLRTAVRQGAQVDERRRRQELLPRRLGGGLDPDFPDRSSVHGRASPAARPVICPASATGRTRSCRTTR